MNCYDMRQISVCLLTEVRENMQQMLPFQWIADGTSRLLWVKFVTLFSTF